MAGLDVRLLNDPFLLIQVGKFRCDALLSGRDLCALRLAIVHIDCLSQVGCLPSGKVFVALRKLPLVAASLSHQRVLLGTRTRLPACDLCGKKRRITNGAPFKFTTKAILVPHLHLVLCVIGAHGMLGRWFVQVNDWTEVRDLDHLNYHTPNQLNSLWREYHDEIAVPEGATVTIYHIGFSLEARVIHAYAYRSTNQFRSELLPYGLAVKPECPVLDHYDLPTDIRRMLDTQRTIEAVRPPHERVYIGGEIQIHHLTMDGCSIYSLGRFEDYEQHEQSMYENFRPKPRTASVSIAKR